MVFRLNYFSADDYQSEIVLTKTGNVTVGIVTPWTQAKKQFSLVVAAEDFNHHCLRIARNIPQALCMSRCRAGSASPRLSTALFIADSFLAGDLAIIKAGNPSQKTH
ncbi:hypothetical protein [Erwinia sp. JUb26]|uniref:hypothetical protein n=1 Tax=Erwinia sp. JUb26 TaxID=2485126 RepID=UPI0011CDF01B|nr:hypothetical protein [Erwinia sp. JUb26]